MWNWLLRQHAILSDVRSMLSVGTCAAPTLICTAEQGRDPDDLVQEVVARHFEEETTLSKRFSAAKKHCGAGSISHTSKSASGQGGS